MKKYQYQRCMNCLRKIIKFTVHTLIKYQQRQYLYYNIFYSCWNLSFFQTKKDQYTSCDVYKTTNKEDKIQLRRSHYDHLDKMHQSFIFNDIDSLIVKNANKYSYLIVSFDL